MHRSLHCIFDAVKRANVPHVRWASVEGQKLVGDPARFDKAVVVRPQAVLNKQLRKYEFSKFVELVHAEASSLDHINLVVAIGRVAKEAERQKALASKDKLHNLMSVLLEQSRQKLSSMRSTHSLANLAWALARLSQLNMAGGSDDVCLASLMRLLVRHALGIGFGEMPARDAVTIIWAAASLRRHDESALRREDRDKLLEEMSEGFALRLPELEPQGLAMLLWALAAIEGRAGLGDSAMSPSASRAFFLAVANEAAGRVEKMKAREVANVAWAFATLHIAAPAWLVTELPARAREFNPQECANALWALAVVSAPVEELAQALHLSEGVSDGETFFKDWKAQEMANAAWALAHCQRNVRPRLELQRSMRFALASRVDELNGLELAMVIATFHGNAPAASDGDLLQRLVGRAEMLLKEGALPADAAVQVVDCLTSCGRDVPQALAAAFDEIHSAAADVLKRFGHQMRERDDASSPHVALQKLGLTTAGAAGTQALLEILGLDEGLQRRSLPPELGSEPTPQVRCALRYHLLLSTTGIDQQEHQALNEPGRVLVSGSRPEGRTQLQPTTLRFPRDRDAEFQALAAVELALARAAKEFRSDLQSEGRAWQVRGTVQLHVSHTPCLSCVSVMVQFRRRFPSIRLCVAFQPRPPLAP